MYIDEDVWQDKLSIIIHCEVGLSDILAYYVTAWKKVMTEKKFEFVLFCFRVNIWKKFNMSIEGSSVGESLNCYSRHNAFRTEQ
jgi:hypothetical protein